MKSLNRLTSVATLMVVMIIVTGPGYSIPVAARQTNVPTIARRNTDIDHVARNTKSVRSDAAKRSGFTSYGEPKEPLLGSIARKQLGANASQQQIGQRITALRADWNNKNYHGPDPKAYQQIQHNEQRALAANSSPAALGLAVTGTLRLLAVAVEFVGTDTLTGTVTHPVSVDDRTCVTDPVGTQYTGPVHNQIPQPGARDNFTLWRSSYERDYYEKTVFSTEGITERVRLDLTDPEDGKPGINIAGQTMRNFYTEVSGGRVKFDGGPSGVLAWLQVPHSEAYYGATVCSANPDTGDIEAGDIADMQGLPSNPEFGFGPSQLIADTISAINAANPNFPWKDYDTDGDGVVDHMVLFHAGKDKSGGGGSQRWQALWAHRSSLPGDDSATPQIENTKYVASNGGTPNDPSDDIRIAGYTMQYEDADVGVLVHEFGHDLGLPDLYDTTRAGESSTDAWDLMSLGSNTGKLIGTNPTNMSAWDKFALGWTDPKVISPTTNLQELKLGQTSNPPSGTTQSVRVDLPNTVIQNSALPEGSTFAWWSNNDQSGADNTLTRDIPLPATGPISVSFDLDGESEEDWDYMFVEVSIDGGQTFTQTKGFDADTGDELTTPDDYGDPNGALKRNGKVHGYTGDTGGFLRVYHDLTRFAGQTIKLRFTYRTDEAVLKRGFFIDNLRVTAGATTILDDPIESNTGWTAAINTRFTGYPLGAGWILNDGTTLSPKYYLLEWRSGEGFDSGLFYTYHTIFSELTADGRDEFYVDHTRSNVPGMLVWLRDTRYGQEPFGADNSILDDQRLLDSPSEGPKGGLLIVDAHPQPIRGPRGGTITTDYGTYPYPPADNWRGRVQSLNAAFSLQSTPPFTISIASGAASPATTVVTHTSAPVLPGVSGFHDALGYYPGVEELPQPIKTFEGENPPGGPFVSRLKKYALTDADTSVVIPAKGYYPPRTPSGFTGRGGESSPPSASISTFETIYAIKETTTGINQLTFADNIFTMNIGDAGGTNVTGQHSGNPGSDNLQYGNHFEVVGQARDGSYGTIRIYSRQYAAEVHGSFVASPVDTKQITVTATLQNVGSPMAPALYSDFDETQATYVDGSATNGAVPVQATLAQVEAALKSGGEAAVRKLAAPAAGPVTAVVLFPANNLDTGASLSFSYRLTRTGPNVKIVNRAIGPGFAEQSVTQTGQTLYLPVVGRTQAAK